MSSVKIAITNFRNRRDLDFWILRKEKIGFPKRRREITTRRVKTQKRAVPFRNWTADFEQFCYKHAKTTNVFHYDVCN